MSFRRAACTRFIRRAAAGMCNVVILAAGLGTRLGRPHPKPLTRLADGRTILRLQLHNPRTHFGPSLHIMVVVG
ncbi:NTP transferase domain-containing protein [Allorhizocola rhizosphaerae]|uniref:NTP transferase domain-containing protein n=1 Tax=Allorhizocola rhizosphaerae TaxID=1872709 RepID=UPI001FE85666|nr:NTP transferase domain-containing protein [Allorhizocola rhizosphaerae]